MAQLNDLRTHRWHSLTPGMNSASNLLELGRALDVSEPLDCMYGFLGLMDEDIRNSIIIDYSLQSRQFIWKTYLAVGKCILQHEGMILLRNTDLATGTPELPSWLPNWNVRLGYHHLAVNYYAGFHFLITIPRHGWRFCGHKSSIEVGGFTLGTIVAAVLVRFPNDRDQSDENSILGLGGFAADFLRIIQEALSLWQSTSRENEDMRMKRFARTLILDRSLEHTTRSSIPYEQDSYQDFLFCYRWFRYFAYDDLCGFDEIPSQEQHHRHVSPYSNNAKNVLTGRSIFVTGSGHIGVASQTCRAGDIVNIILEACYPFDLRPIEGSEAFKLVGMSYVDGVMYGESLAGKDMANDKNFIIE
ncbi:hypothetical protein EJ08DRAFT_694222 [Tothia fuscella]|uniref:Uncharacterized protein n=1 Tax=Tothia fuscella TaxID=1048955 RepID=A0A9P4NYK8_9PEZI|nr:hypothetical protein EJ08DRAFT_694222 [Tothia fuscella]